MWRNGCRKIVLVAGLVACSLILGANEAHARADYHDASEMEEAVLLLEGGALGRMAVHEIGRSYEGRSIYAVQIAQPTTASQLLPDPGDKPALLIECGTHAREWVGPQMCLMFLQAFHLGAVLDSDRIDEILEQVTIWVVPMVNPDGRAMDDADGGDPTRHWSSLEWHSASESDLNGWRDNAQLLGESKGIDLNRNFSAGWSVADPAASEWNPDSNHYHGEAPFQAPEANVLRRFVQNHMISMSLSVHSNGSSIRSRNGSSVIADRFADVWNASVTCALTLSSNHGPSGGGMGQFTAWVADTSDTAYDESAGVRDHSTRRGAMTLLLELPPDSADQYDGLTFSIHEGTVTCSDAYTFFDSAMDDSNHFHPSGDDFLGDTFQGFYDAVAYLAEQARLPWSPLDPETLEPDTSIVRDFGLTGSKIAACKNCEGKLRFKYEGPGAHETLKPSRRKIVYRVQNFDSTTGTAEQVRATVIVSSRTAWPEPYTTEMVDTQEIELGPAAAETVAVSFRFLADRDYMVSIRLTPLSFSGDTQTDNDFHLYRFRTLSSGTGG